MKFTLSGAPWEFFQCQIFDMTRYILAFAPTWGPAVLVTGGFADLNWLPNKNWVVTQRLGGKLWVVLTDYMRTTSFNLHAKKVQLYAYEATFTGTEVWTWTHLHTGHLWAAESVTKSLPVKWKSTVKQSSYVLFKCSRSDQSLNYCLPSGLSTNSQLIVFFVFFFTKLSFSFSIFCSNQMI